MRGVGGTLADLATGLGTTAERQRGLMERQASDNGSEVQMMGVEVWVLCIHHECMVQSVGSWYQQRRQSVRAHIKCVFGSGRYGMEVTVGVIAKETTNHEGARP